ncbi:MAG TPA: dihydrofolate reductase family protein [Gryllotalpicola sp.]
MAKLLYSASMSLDGYIAGPGGDMSWLTPRLGPDPLIDGLIPQIGALLVGWRTFGGDDPNRLDPAKAGKPFGGGWSGEQFVLTHRSGLSALPGITFVDSLPGAVAAARAAAGDGYVNVLGADVARQLIETGQLDEVLVGIVPVLLGDGTPLFERAGAPVALERLTANIAAASTDAWFRVVYPE